MFIFADFLRVIECSPMLCKIYIVRFWSWRGIIGIHRACFRHWCSRYPTDRSGCRGYGSYRGSSAMRPRLVDRRYLKIECENVSIREVFWLSRVSRGRRRLNNWRGLRRGTLRECTVMQRKQRPLERDLGASFISGLVDVFFLQLRGRSLRVICTCKPARTVSNDTLFLHAHCTIGDPASRLLCNSPRRNFYFFHYNDRGTDFSCHLFKCLKRLFKVFTRQSDELTRVCHTELIISLPTAFKQPPL